MRIILTSDTHGCHDELDVPEGDVFIHAGDFTNIGRPDEVEDFNEWLAELPHRHKLIIAGNHDFLFEQEPDYARSLLTDCTYLQDTSVTLEGVRFYGSPYTPRFHDWAFNLDPGHALRDVWAKIPKGTDVLITHGPPFGICDKNSEGEFAGCRDLTDAIAKLRPRLHVFGHIHEGYGVQSHHALGTTFVNACALGSHLKVIRHPVVIDL